MDLAWIAFIAGLAVFLGVHSVRVFADDWRTHQVARLGANAWKGLYSLLSVASFLLLLWGYAQVRQGQAPLFLLPEGAAKGLRHLAALLMLPAFWLIVAAYVPRNHFKAALKHPMTLSVKVWALGHLLVNHSASDLLLFGGFLVWAVLLFRRARRRPAPAPAAAHWVATTAVLLVGSAAYLGFAFWLHARWIGVAPFLLKP